MEKNDDLVVVLGEFVLYGLGFSIMAPFGVLVYQIYWYLRIGEWEPLSVITGLRWMKVDWAFHPNEWIGLYKILNDMPLAFGIFIFTFFPLLLALWIVVGGSGK